MSLTVFTELPYMVLIKDLQLMNLMKINAL